MCDQLWGVFIEALYLYPGEKNAEILKTKKHRNWKGKGHSWQNIYFCSKEKVHRTWDQYPSKTDSKIIIICGILCTLDRGSPTYLRPRNRESKIRVFKINQLLTRDEPLRLLDMMSLPIHIRLRAKVIMIRGPVVMWGPIGGQRRRFHGQTG